MNTLLVVKSLINGFFTILNIFILSQYVVTEYSSFIPNGCLYHLKLIEIDIEFYICRYIKQDDETS